MITEPVTNLTVDEFTTAVRENLIKLGADNSVLGETQYFLYLDKHPSERYFDWNTSIFVGSIPGSDIVEEFVHRYSTGIMNPRTVNFALELISEHPGFSKLLREDINNLE